jgi:hypothetical protein
VNVDVLDGAADRPPTGKSRRLGIIIGVIVVLGVGAVSGGVALGLIRFPFMTPAPQPTVSAPSITPTPVVTAAVGASTIPLSCEQLFVAGDLSSLTQGDLVTSASPVAPEQAALLQHGVRDCDWPGEEQQKSIHLQVSSSPVSAASWIASERAAGGVSLQVGDDSVIRCDTQTVQCDASVVTGTYWLEATAYLAGGPVAEETAALRLSFQGILGGLESSAPPLRPWVAPSTTWSSVTNCSGLTTSPSLADVLGHPTMTGPVTISSPEFHYSGIDLAVGWSDCRWSIPNPYASMTVFLPSVDVAVAPGSGWAFPSPDAASHLTSTAVDVTGADRAEFICGPGQDPSCWLDVLVDKTWIQVGLQTSASTSAEKPFVAVAEAILAGHKP